MAGRVCGMHARAVALGVGGQQSRAALLDGSKRPLQPGDLACSRVQSAASELWVESAAMPERGASAV